MDDSIKIAFPIGKTLNFLAVSKLCKYVFKISFLIKILLDVGKP